MSRSQFDEMRLSESFLSRSQRHIRRSTSRERAYVVRQVKNKHTSFARSRLDNQNTDDEIIKQSHENESSQTVFA